MKKLLTLTVVLLAAQVSLAEVISVNFYWENPVGEAAVGVPIDGAPVANWNEVYVKDDQSVTSFVDSDGNAVTGLTLTYDVGDRRRQMGTGDPDSKMLRDGVSGGMTLSGLDQWSSWEIIVYAGNKDGNDGIDMTDGTTSYFGKSYGAVDFDGTWTQATSTDSSSPTLAAEYFVFTGTNDTVTITSNVSGGADRENLMGFQIIAVPEPATMSLLGLGGLAILRRRRR